MTILLADIGGTYARFGCLDDDGIISRKFKCAVKDYLSLEEALKHYVQTFDITLPAQLHIATAAQPESEIHWRFLNRNPWLIDIPNLETAGFTVQNIINDFMATAHATLHVPEEGITALKDEPQRPDLPRVIIGPGTGLGLSYLVPVDHQRWHVQQTYGGHMAAIAFTQEQQGILARVKTLKEQAGNNTIVVPEDIISGRGLPFLYTAVCQTAGYDSASNVTDNISASNILAGDSPAARQTIRIFTEFLGLFAHTTAVTIHGYGGLYLDGGILKYLYREKQFDFDRFQQFFILDAVPVVSADLDATPVYLITDPFVALYGLAGLVSSPT